MVFAVDLKIATTVVSASRIPKKKLSGAGLLRWSAISIESWTYFDILNGWNMFRNVANDLFETAAIRLTNGRPVYISPIRSKLGLILSISITWREVIEIICKCSISSYFLRKETDSFLSLERAM